VWLIARYVWCVYVVEVSHEVIIYQSIGQHCPPFCASNCLSLLQTLECNFKNKINGRNIVVVQGKMEFGSWNFKKDYGEI